MVSAICQLEPKFHKIPRVQLLDVANDQIDTRSHEAYTGSMEVRFSPELQQKIDRTAARQGRDSESSVLEPLDGIVVPLRIGARNPIWFRTSMYGKLPGELTAEALRSLRLAQRRSGSIHASSSRI